MGCKRALASAKAAVVVALEGKTPQFWRCVLRGYVDVDAVILLVVRGGYEVPSINTVGGPGAAVARCLMDNNSGAGRC